METMDLHTITSCDRYKTRMNYSQLNNNRSTRFSFDPTGQVKDRASC